MTEMEILKNEAGGIDLVIERDSGNSFRVLTGKKEASLKTWIRLKTLCELSIKDLEK